MNFLLIFSFLTSIFQISRGQVYLRADGSSDAYRTVDNVFGNNACEVPDCGHNVKHITQEYDSSLRQNIFIFHSHVNEDTDRCKTPVDRQRTEIKIFGPSREYLKGRRGERVSFSWDFKLDANFQPSTKFTHIHQIKAGDGNNGDSPLITITPRKANRNRLEIIHTDSNNKRTRLGRNPANLSDFLGQWIHVIEEITYDTRGRYSIQLINKNSGRNLFSHTTNSIEMWREGSTFMRPKWGIYRSLDDKRSLRDEKVGFFDFCLAKGSDRCR